MSPCHGEDHEFESRMVRHQPCQCCAPSEHVLRFAGPIAQLVEHSTENAGVGGSTPPWATKTKTSAPALFLFVVPRRVATLSNLDTSIFSIFPPPRALGPRFAPNTPESQKSRSSIWENRRFLFIEWVEVVYESKKKTKRPSRPRLRNRFRHRLKRQNNQRPKRSSSENDAHDFP